MAVGLFQYKTKAGPRWGAKLKLKGVDGIWRRKTKYIQTQLGHSSINVTLDIYSHLYGNERAVDRLEQSGKVARI